MRNGWFEWGLGAAFTALIGAGIVIFNLDSQESNASPTPINDDSRNILAAFTSAEQLVPNRYEIREGSVKRNETLIGLLDRLGAARKDSNPAVYAVGDLYDLRTVRSGQDVKTWMEPTDEGNLRLVGLSLRPDAERQILVERNLDGNWIARELTAKLSPSLHRVAGTIDDSIYTAALAMGARDQQVVDFADVFAYDIDFQRDLRTGDKFEIFYETLDDERGNQVKSGDVIFASFHGRALSKDFYRYTPSDDGATDFFDAEGQSAKKFLMKTPINGARLSSHFGNRKHPVLGYNKLHKGTDFAAPRGTPIYAAGNGVIERAGPFSTYGNYVRIGHANGYQTAYAHMRNIARGIRKGKRVRQGQIIGYVGTTGRSTGPHLHYEVHVNKKPVNAMRLKLPTGRKLKDTELEAFMLEKSRIDEQRAAKGAQFVQQTKLSVNTTK